MSQRRLSFAPLEGVTGWVFRRVHRARFPGLDRYYAPFFAPTVDSPLTGRGLTDLLPEHNQGVPVVPQLLANRAEAFLAAAQVLADLGYEEVNLNLGCPSGTVVAKGKGAGFLSQPQALDAFLDEVFRRTPLAISIKTRIGVTDEGEWPALLAVFGRYPIRELIVHPRLRRDFYRGPVRRQAFQYAVDHCSLPLCSTSPCVTMGTSLPPRPAGSWPPSSPPSPTGWQAGGWCTTPPWAGNSKGANP